MPGTTARLALPYALGTDQVSTWPAVVDFPSKTTLDGSVIYTTGTLSGRPATPAYSGQIYYATDIQVPYLSYNGLWNAIDLTPTTVSGNYTAADGQAILCTAPVTITLPTPTAGAEVMVTNQNLGIVTVSGGAYTIFGAGLTSATSFGLGYGTAALLIAAGSTWTVMGGGPSSFHVSSGASITAIAGQTVECTGTTQTVTIPNPNIGAGATVTVTAAGSQTGAAPVTVTTPAGVIHGVGLSGATSILLGTPGASVTLLSDYSNWFITAGQQDSGWVALSLSSNVATTLGYTASARLQGDAVKLKGTLTNNTGSSDTGTLATISAGLRPSATVYSIAGLLVNGGGLQIQITTAGALSVPSGLGNTGTIGFDGVTYSLS